MNKKYFRPQLRIWLAVAMLLGTWATFARMLPDPTKDNSLALILVSASSLVSGFAVVVLILTLTRDGQW